MLPSVNDKISVKYYRKRGEDIWHNTSMLIEDFHQGIVPLYGLKFEEISCSLHPRVAEFENNIGELLPSYQSRYRDSFKEIILGTIGYFANAILNNGYIALELVKYTDINKKVFFKLEPFIGDEIKVQKRKVIQIISEEKATELGISKSIAIPNDKCFYIEFPKSLGGKSDYLKFIEDFKFLDNQTPMMNYFSDSLNGQKGYDIIEHQKLHDLELWKKSKKFNWNHRGTNNLFSGYYSIYRLLNFEKSKILLRDYIIEHLKAIILTVSERVAEKAELQIEGLTTLEKVEEKIRQWKTGELIPTSIRDI